jgi:hypothetical protein
MDCCREEKRIVIPGLERLPILRYLKEPVQWIEELYERYPDGGEAGWFALVGSLKSFAYWDSELRAWAPIHVGGENVNLICFMDVEQEKLIMSPGETQKIKVTIYDGYNRDVTNQYRQLDVERDSGDFYSDDAWNDAYGKNKPFAFEITWADLNFREDRSSTQFRLLARKDYDTLLTDTLKIGR